MDGLDGGSAELETRGDPVRVANVVLCWGRGIDCGSCCYTAAREREVKRNRLRARQDGRRGERW